MKKAVCCNWLLDKKAKGLVKHGGPEFWTEQILGIVDDFMKKVFA